MFGHPTNSESQVGRCFKMLPLPPPPSAITIYGVITCAGSRCFTCVTSFVTTTVLSMEKQEPHFTAEKTEAQKRTCMRSGSWEVAEQGVRPSFQ